MTRELKKNGRTDRDGSTTREDSGKTDRFVKWFLMKKGWCQRTLLNHRLSWQLGLSQELFR